MRGKFIVLEGGEGSGKSSAIEHLKKHLKKHNVIYTREPGGTASADKIRELLISGGVPGDPLEPLAELGLIFAARAQHIARRIRPALEQGTHVICDRFSASTFAYQILNLRPELEGIFFMMDEIFRGGISHGRVIKHQVDPDLYILMDVDPEIGIMRSTKAGHANNFEKRPLEFHQRVRNGFFTYLAGKPVYVVDSHKAHKETLREVLSIVREALSGSLR